MGNQRSCPPAGAPSLHTAAVMRTRSRRTLVALVTSLILLVACSGETELAVPETGTSDAPTVPTTTSQDPTEPIPDTTTTEQTLQSTLLPSTAIPSTTAWVPLTNDSRILIIGDSISLGYLPFVAEHFGDDGPLVAHNEGNAQSTNHALSSNRIYDWVAGDWDVIYFNFGLHDLSWADQDQTEVAVGTDGAGPRVPLDHYESQLQQIVDILGQTEAHLIFATTTPVYTTEGSRFAGAEISYNEAALSVMQRNGIQVSDLHAYALGNIRVNHLVGGSDNIHFNAAGYQVLAETVVTALENPPTR